MHEYLIGICIYFSYVCHFPIPLNGGGRRGGGEPPSVMESIKLDGKVANVRKAYANTNQIFVYLDISWILLYFLTFFPELFQLARCRSPRTDECCFVDTTGPLGDPGGCSGTPRRPRQAPRSVPDPLRGQQIDIQPT